MVGVDGERAFTPSTTRLPSNSGMTRSESTRSIPPLPKISIASLPLVVTTTRYPRVSNMTFRMERDCSLSSTHKMVFLGLMPLLAQPRIPMGGARAGTAKGRAQLLNVKYGRSRKRSRILRRAAIHGKCSSTHLRKISGSECHRRKIVIPPDVAGNGRGDELPFRRVVHNASTCFQQKRAQGSSEGT